MEVYKVFRDTKQDSKYFGGCEVCGKPCDKVFHVKTMKSVVNPVTGKHGEICVSDGYGHKECFNN